MWWDRGGIEKLALLGFDPGPCGSHVGHVLEHCSKIKNSENIQPILLICLLVSLWLRIYFFAIWRTHEQHLLSHMWVSPEYQTPNLDWTQAPEQANPHTTAISSWSLQSAHPYEHFFCKPTPPAATTSSLSLQHAHPYGHFLCKPTPMHQLSPVGPSSLPIHMDIQLARQPPCNNYLQLAPLQFACWLSCPKGSLLGTENLTDI